MTQLPVGIEQDAEVQAGLNWLATASGDANGFWQRIEAAQRCYHLFASALENLGRDPELANLGLDVVASVLAQAKSLLDGRRTYDIVLASRCIPWVKQIGVNASELARIPGAVERARRMLADQATAPDGPLLELVMGGQLRCGRLGCRLRRGSARPSQDAGPSPVPAGCGRARRD